MTNANKRYNNTMTKLNRQFFVEAGRKGGQAVLKKRGKEYLRKLARKAAKIRWAKHNAGKAK